MKKVTILLAVFGLAALVSTGCGKKEEAEQTSASQTETPETTSAVNATTAAYTCPMHPEVTSDTAAKCSQCGMDLEKKEETAPALFICPMHPEERAVKAGKCSQCGMDLVQAEVIVR